MSSEQLASDELGTSCEGMTCNTKKPLLRVSKAKKTLMLISANRLAAANILFTGGFVAASVEVCKSSNPVLITILGITAAIHSMNIVAIAQFAGRTVLAYERTKQHIQKFGRIDRRYLKTWLGHESKYKITGYCQLQGMYLAAQEEGLTKEFAELKGTHTKNIVPNF